MTTQSIKPQVSDLFSNASVSKSVTNRNSSSINSFSSVMDNSLKSNNNIEDQDKSNEAQTVSNNSIATENVEEENSIQQDSDVTLAETTQSQQTTSTDTNVADSGLMEKSEEVTELISSTVQETLDVSEEELNAMLESLGLTMLDLLNMDNLKQLVLLANGSEDITSVLTNENLANSLQDMIQAIESLKIGETFQLTSQELTVLMSQNNAEENALLAMNDPAASMQKELETDSAHADSVISKTNVVTVEVQKTSSMDLTSGNNSDTETAESNQTEIDLSTQLDSIINNLTVLSGDTSQSFTEQIATNRLMQDITNQIVEQIKVIIKPDQTEMDLQLNPENLGKINLSVISKNGILTAQFTAQNELVKEAIESQMHILRENLNSQGLKVESIEVTVSNFGFEQSNQTATGEEQNNSNSQKRGHFRDESEISAIQAEEDNVPINLMDQNGSRIDYTA